jgi:glycosyltransferase involved in cell wall biosynthesis
MQQINENLNVGYVSPGWPLSSNPNGIVAYIENIISGFDHKQVNPLVLSFGMNEPEIEGFSVDIQKYDNYKNLPLEYLIKVLLKFRLNYAEKIKYQHFLRGCEHIYEQTLSNLNPPLDIIEMEESFGAIYYPVGKSKTRYVTRLHGPWFTMKKIFNLDENGEYKLRVFYEGEAIKRAHGVTAPSLDVLDKVREFYNIELPNAKVIPNPIPYVKKENQWQFIEENPYILFVGRFDSHKGGDLIIDSFNIIAQRDKEIELFFVGPDRGFKVDNILLSIEQYIEKFIKDESIRKRIKLLGHCDSKKITSLRQKARVTICCSRYENFPVSLLEALATGCPTVATAVGGIKEILIDNQNGLFADPESPDSIAEKVLSLLYDQSKLTSLSKKAIEDVEKRFSAKDIANQSIEYYRSVLSNRFL